MMQFSTYIRYCRNDSEYAKYFRRVKSFAPRRGDIRIFAITESQYKKMYHFAGRKKSDEELLGPVALIVFE
ncbi:hypothetical protein AwErysi_07600 [Erysipelotrichaceae bacterium]|nr:hypothetical protein AwErysi_07600 [Erysipelotrichaceae bacterium]